MCLVNDIWIDVWWDIEMPARSAIFDKLQHQSKTRFYAHTYTHSMLLHANVSIRPSVMDIDTSFFSTLLFGSSLLFAYNSMEYGWIVMFQPQIESMLLLYTRFLFFRCCCSLLLYFQRIARLPPKAKPNADRPTER